ncbi:LOW QUALITY PROTEIN: membrane-spanning 4-domains subfamily A member 4A [Puntigrus tetrazona]|uniref:LOW QUALITY PROTEIN: membrane-spanning 4-domains subfamily A member 4A n=1 Tax=Puntigrus tetrazona TaxID=1606681 RepID=UPI001C89C714|nr:LOW QUALITY PROTEIN: membrane-spanning 4-domains subfamily A member 4A [Puntigrus tetrazona]
MASSMTTEANGVRVVTHVIPLEEKTQSSDLKTSSGELEESNLSAKNKMFLKGKPLSLGLVQVFIGVVVMTLCTITVLVDMLNIETVMSLGLPFVVSGSVAIAAHKRSSSSLIKATLSMSVICALLAAAGIGYFSWELSNRPGVDPCSDGDYWSCSYMIWRFNSLMDGLKGLLLVLCFLELCVCISLAIFSARAIRQSETDADPYNSNSSLLKVGVDCVSNP